MRKTLFSLLVCLSLVVLAVRFGSKPMSQFLGYQSKAGLKITSTPEAMVSVGGLAVGKTPYQNENLKVGEYQISLQSDKSSWQGAVKLTAGTLSIVNRELSPSIASSSGEILTLDSGSGVVITSNPGAAEVEIDGKVYGETPLAISDLPPGDRTFILSKNNYLKRSVRALVPQKMSLHIAVDLAVSEIDLGTISTPSVAPAIKLVIKQTSTGFLRVRDKPSLSGVEVGRLSPGESVIQLEELPGWFKVKLDNGTEGYVASSYVQKQS